MTAQPEMRWHTVPCFRIYSYAGTGCGTGWMLWTSGCLRLAYACGFGRCGGWGSSYMLLELNTGKRNRNADAKEFELWIDRLCGACRWYPGRCLCCRICRSPCYTHLDSYSWIYRFCGWIADLSSLPKGNCLWSAVIWIERNGDAGNGCITVDSFLPALYGDGITLYQGQRGQWAVFLPKPRSKAGHCPGLTDKETLVMGRKQFLFCFSIAILAALVLLLDRWFRAKYTSRIIVPSTRACRLCFDKPGLYLDWAANTIKEATP